MATASVTEAIGSQADSIIRAAAERHMGGFIQPSQQLSAQQQEQAVRALERAIDYWLAVLLGFINTQGSADTYGTQDLRYWNSAVRCWIGDEQLARELLTTMLYPDRVDLPRAEILEASRQRAQPVTPPYDYPWRILAESFRRGVVYHGFLSDDLRERLKPAAG